VVKCALIVEVSRWGSRLASSSPCCCSWCSGGARGTLAGEPGFEPGLTDPESAVLPLDDSPTASDYI
jgi:hypothetical protein